MSEKNPSKEIFSISSKSKKWIPHLIAILIFFAVTLSYFHPIVFGNKEILQEDIMRFRSVSKEIVDYREKTGEETLWTNSMFCGMPAYQISVQYISNNLKYLNAVFSFGIPVPVRMVFFYFLGFYILMLVLKIDPWIGIICSLAFGLSSYFFIIIEAGHNSKSMAIAYMAPALAGFILTFRGKILAGGAMTAFFLTMEIYCNHPQITYYLGLLLVIYVIAEFTSAIKRKKIFDFLKQCAVLGIAGIIALGVNITSLWATADYSKYTIRGKTELTINPDGTSNKSDVTSSGLDKSYATAWSYGVGETMTMLIPDFKGGSSSPIGNNKDAMKNIDPQMRESVAQMYQYFGDQPFTSGPVYIGAIIVFLFMLGIFLPISSSSSNIPEGKNVSSFQGNENVSLKWTLIIGTIFSIWLSWGKNDPFGLTDFMLNYFPAYNKFRAVSMILVIAELTIPLLAALTLNNIICNQNFLKDKVLLAFKYVITKQKILFIAFGLTGGIALLCWLAPGIFTNFSTTGEYDEIFGQIKRSNASATDAQIKNYLDQIFPVVETVRESIVKADAIRSFFFILLAAVAIWFFLKKKINKKILLGFIAVLVMIDMTAIDKRYLNNESFVKKSDNKNPAAKMGRPNQADIEIMNDKDIYFRVWNTFSRPDQDAATSYFHKSISGYHGAKLKRYQDIIDFHINRRNMAVINMLNTKYIIVPGEKNEPVAYPNKEANGNAWFVNEYRIVASPDSEIMALNHFDSKKTAIVDKRFENEFLGFKQKKDSLSTIKLTSYQPDKLTYQSTSSSEEIAVFSEIYYVSGWNAYIDGKLFPHFRVNYVLRAMRVPSGKHQIEFKFEPSLYATGEKISTASLIVLFLFCGGALFMNTVAQKKYHS
ncbi:MAG: YfhO family protein [Bacteroidota bacterium]